MNVLLRTRLLSRSGSHESEWASCSGWMLLCAGCCVVSARCTKLLMRDRVIDSQASRLFRSSSMPVADAELAVMSVHQNASQGRHWTPAMFIENTPGFCFTSESVLLGPWRPPWGCFLSYNLREFCFACHLEYFANLNFLGCYNRGLFVC